MTAIKMPIPSTHNQKTSPPSERSNASRRIAEMMIIVVPAIAAHTGTALAPSRFSGLSFRARGTSRATPSTKPNSR